MKKKLRQAGIQTNLLVLICLFILLPLCGTLFFLCLNMQHKSVSIIQNGTESMTSQITANANQVVESCGYVTSMFMVEPETLSNLRQLLSDEDSDSYTFYNAQVDLSKHISMVESSALGAIKGRIAILTESDYLLSAGNISLIQQDYRAQSWYKQVLDNGRKLTFNSGISSIFQEIYPTETIWDRDYLYVGRSIYDYSNRQLGVTVLRIASEKIWNQFLSELSTDAALAILSSDGTIQLAYPRDAFCWQQFYSEELLSSALHGFERDGIYYSSKQLQYANAWLLFQQPSSSYFSSTRLFNKRLWWIGVGIILLSCFVTFIIARRISKPLALLTARLDYLETVPLRMETGISTFREATQLIESYNRAGIRIRELMEKIRVESALKEKAHYDVLISQISPHFIFNTTNSIRYLAVSANDKQTAEALEAFGVLLRSVYERHSNDDTLGRELHILASYIKIMRMRFGYFEYVNVIPAEYAAYRIPVFTLQPLVENAILHGVKGTKSGQIILSAFQEDDALQISVFNTGNRADADVIRLSLQEEHREPQHFSGIGLYNINRRLKLLYGESYGLSFNESRTVGCEILIRLPLSNADTCK